MKKLKYLGPHAETQVYGLGVVARGEEYDVPDELANSLLQQKGCWEELTRAMHRKFKPSPRASRRRDKEG